MKIELTPQQKNDQAEFRAFVKEEIIPHANRYDQEEYTPAELITRVAQQGYLGALVAQENGGAGMDMITFGLLNEEIGRGCSSIRSLLTVHSMVTFAQVSSRATPSASFSGFPRGRRMFLLNAAMVNTTAVAASRANTSGQSLHSCGAWCRNTRFSPIADPATTVSQATFGVNR